MLIYVKLKRVARHVNYKEKRIVNLREMKLDHRNYLDLNEKTCFRLSDHARLKPTYSVTEIS